MARFTESEVEEVALDLLAAFGYPVAHGPEIAPGEVAAEREAYSQVVLEGRLREALARLKAELPQEALDDALRRITRPEGPTLETRNRAFHRMLVDGVTVEYRTGEGRNAGAQARVIDFDAPDNNEDRKSTRLNS